MSFTPAKMITSSQEGIHENLETTVIKHLSHAYRKPIASHNQDMFNHAYQWYQGKQPKDGKRDVILDSGCGTGESSRFLATHYPEHLIIGLDQSAKRLDHNDNQHLPENCLLLRCECTDFWRLADQQHWQFSLHTLFYPNPYPKPQHLQRRWHGSAALLHLLNISQRIILRTNWKIYAEEFYATLELTKNKIANKEIHQELLLMQASDSFLLEEYFPEKTITAFERKYLLSQHPLWQVSSQPTLQDLTVI